MDDMKSESEIFARGLLSGKVVLVTGGGTGLGRATALELARCGARVVIAGRRAEVLEAAAAQGAELEGTIDWVAGDIRERDGARRLIATVLERAGGLDVLVNNAGGQFFSPAELIATKGWRAVWRLNVGGMLNMSEAAFELAFAPATGLVAAELAGAGPIGTGPGRMGTGHAGGGAIVNVTLSPHHGMPGMAHSGSARATVEALTRELARTWADAGVTVAAVAAGTFDTEVMVKYPRSVRAGMSRSVPMQRLGTVSEHAWLVTLLASPLGRAFSGSTVTLDGARDNGFGPWPPLGLVDEAGEVPVEERKQVRGE